MSRSWFISSMDMPRSLPHQTVVNVSNTVTCIKPTKEQPEHGLLQVHISPDYSHMPRSRRRLVMSFEKTPSLEFPYAEVGTFEFQGQEAFILLENAQ